MKYKLILVLILLLAMSCNNNLRNNNTTSNIINELKRREFELKKRELDLQKETNQVSIPKKKNDLAILYKQLKKSIFLIYTVDNNKNIKQGTAFTIDNTGIALSNYHVFANASNAVAINEYGDKYLINEVIGYDKKSDYFAFRLGPNNNNFDFLKLANKLPEIGEDCFAIGNPKGLTNTISKGIISSYREDGKKIQTDATFTHGSSGGPLFNKDGEVIGITSSGIEGEDLNFAININSIPINDILSKSFKTVAHSSEFKTVTFSPEEYISRYFNLLQDQQFDQALNMFSENVKRFYSKFNPTTNYIYKAMHNYRAKSKIKSVNIDIDYNTIETYKSANGTYLISFYMDYTIDRIEKNKPTNFKLKLFMEIDNKKIISIYEDIINKK